MKGAAIFILVILTPCVVSQVYNYTTIPPTDGGLAYVFADEGTNVTVFCQEFLNGNRFLVSWQIQRATESTFTEIEFTDGVSTGPDDVAGDITVTGDFLSDVLTFRSNLTIIEFTSDYDGSMISCGSSPNPIIFNFGFPSK